MPAAAAQDSAGRCAGQLPVLEFDLTIDDSAVDAVGELVGLCVASMIDRGCRIENSYVGEVAGLQKASALEVFALGGKRSDFADGGF